MQLSGVNAISSAALSRNQNLVPDLILFGQCFDPDRGRILTFNNTPDKVLRAFVNLGINSVSYCPLKGGSQTAVLLTRKANAEFIKKTGPDTSCRVQAGITSRLPFTEFTLDASTPMVHLHTQEPLLQQPYLPQPGGVPAPAQQHGQRNEYGVPYFQAPAASSATPTPRPLYVPAYPTHTQPLAHNAPAVSSFQVPQYTPVPDAPPQPLPQPAPVPSFAPATSRDSTMASAPNESQVLGAVGTAWAAAATRQRVQLELTQPNQYALTGRPVFNAPLAQPAPPLTPPASTSADFHHYKMIHLNRTESDFNIVGVMLQSPSDELRRKILEMRVEQRRDIVVSEEHVYIYRMTVQQFKDLQAHHYIANDVKLPPHPVEVAFQRNGGPAAAPSTQPNPWDYRNGLQHLRFGGG